MKVAIASRTGARALAAHLVIGQQDAKHPHVVSRGLTLFGVAVQHLTRTRRGRLRAVDLDMAKEFDRLRPTVFDDLELLLRQIGDRLAIVISDDDIHADDVDAGAEGGRATLRWRRATLRRRSILRAHQRRADEHQNNDDRKSEVRHGLQSNLMSSFSCRPLHALLVVLLPDPGPRAVEQVRHLVFNHLPRHHRRRAAVDRVDRLHALDELVRRAFFEAADPLEHARHADRFDERLGVVEDAFVIEADELAGAVAVRRVDLDRLQLA